MPRTLDRDGLFFEYPVKAGETIKKIVFIPFSTSTWDQAFEEYDTDTYFSKIVVKEKKSAKLVPYNVINRNNTLFSFTGATSRTLTFTADIDVTLLRKIKFNTSQMSNDARNKSKFKFVTLPASKRKDFNSSFNFVKDVFTTCVTTHSSNTVLGPPLIRLKYGDAYQNCLFVCNDVAMSNVSDDKQSIQNQDSDNTKDQNPDRARFDLLNVSLTLKEIRSNSGIPFKPNKLISRDGVAGWESVLGGLGYDPGGVDY